MVAGDYPAPLIAPSANTNNTDPRSVEFQQAAPVIAPEPISPGPVTRSVYDDAVLGPEAPAIVLTSGATAASSPGEGEPIAPTADGDAVNGFGAGQVPDLPPITITDDIWCFFPRLGHDAVGLVNNWN
ncbi:MAG TPA: hypothetical protein VHX68_19695, partial [Planctomycetaceae bacterium]|nr:hypothetical protein [Planctomycetaceae bacterium]